MRHIVTRLLSAASDTQVRHNKNIEEEINTALENRDTEIMLYKKKASDAEKKASDAEKIIAEQTMQLSKQSEQLLSAVKLLRDSGMSDDRIASSLGISIDDAMKMLSSADGFQVR